MCVRRSRLHIASFCSGAIAVVAVLLAAETVVITIVPSGVGSPLLDISAAQSPFRSRQLVTIVSIMAIAMEECLVVSVVAAAGLSFPLCGDCSSSREYRISSKKIMIIGIGYIGHFRTSQLSICAPSNFRQ